MLKSIFFKEWLKIGKIAIVLFAVGFLAIAGIYLNVRHDLVLSDAEKIWDMVVNRQHIYFSIFKFFPLLFGLLVGLAQFVPEIVEKRIKLSLHLPLNEEEVVLKMVSFGAGTVITAFFALFLLFYAWGLVYFPYEIMKLATLTVLPWFMAGLAAYFLSSLIILEPIWKYRIFYMIVAAVFLSMFFKSNIAGAYSPAIVSLLVCILMTSISSIFSIYRFRKGEM